jgi:hypothetical protein
MGFARQQKVVDADMIEQAARDLDMLEPVPEEDPGGKGGSVGALRSRARGIFRLFR